MYKYTWKHALAELLAIVGGLALAYLFMLLGWYACEFRSGAMLAWAMLCVVIAIAPFFALVFNRKIERV